MNMLGLMSLIIIIFSYEYAWFNVTILFICVIIIMLPNTNDQIEGW